MRSYFRISIEKAAIMSTTVTFTGQSSELTANFFPELELDDRFEYSCGLLDFTTYQSVPNIHNGNNKLYFEPTKRTEKFMDKDDPDGKLCITVPIGSYEIEEIVDYIVKRFKPYGITFELVVNKVTLKSTIKCSTDLIFNRHDSIHRVFGFNSRETIKANESKESENIVKITTLNTIIVECDIVSGSYRNGKKTHSLYEFAPKVGVGYKIIEVPRNIIYLPVTTKRIRSIQIKIVDQDRNIIDFRGEEITCRIHIKRD